MKAPAKVRPTESMNAPTACGQFFLASPSRFRMSALASNSLLHHPLGGELHGATNAIIAVPKPVGVLAQQLDKLLAVRGWKLGFERAGDELLELLQVEAIDKTVENTFTRPAPKKVLTMQVFTPDGKVIGIAGKAE